MEDILSIVVTHLPQQALLYCRLMSRQWRRCVDRWLYSQKIAFDIPFTGNTDYPCVLVRALPPGQSTLQAYRSLHAKRINIRSDSNVRFEPQVECLCIEAYVRLTIDNAITKWLSHLTWSSLLGSNLRKLGLVNYSLAALCDVRDVLMQLRLLTCIISLNANQRGDLDTVQLPKTITCLFLDCTSHTRFPDLPKLEYLCLENYRCPDPLVLPHVTYLCVANSSITSRCGKSGEALPYPDLPKLRSLHLRGSTDNFPSAGIEAIGLRDRGAQSAHNEYGARVNCNLWSLDTFICNYWHSSLTNVTSIVRHVTDEIAFKNWVFRAEAVLIVQPSLRHLSGIKDLPLIESSTNLHLRELTLHSDLTSMRVGVRTMCVTVDNLELHGNALGYLLPYLEAAYLDRKGPGACVPMTDADEARRYAEQITFKMDKVKTLRLFGRACAIWIVNMLIKYGLNNLPAIRELHLDAIPNVWSESSLMNTLCSTRLTSLSVTTTSFIDLSWCKHLKALRELSLHQYNPSMVLNVAMLGEAPGIPLGHMIGSKLDWLNEAEEPFAKPDMSNAPHPMDLSAADEATPIPNEFYGLKLHKLHIDGEIDMWRLPKMPGLISLKFHCYVVREKRKIIKKILYPHYPSADIRLMSYMSMYVQ